MKRKLMLLLTCLFMSIGLVTAQTSTVSGVVISDEDGEPVVGASVLVKGTSMGEVTDIEGKFSIGNVPSSAKTLQISFIGMQGQEVAIKRGAILRIVLKADAEMLDEVMVVAYGTAKKSAFTGSASTIKSEKLEQRVTSNVSNALAGQVAGVQITSSDGAPGSSATVRIRGIGSMSASNAPLYVVDGVPFDGAINTINPSDIESMTVLKDAAANSIYGARGANGVILITTKKGQSGEAKVTVDAKWGSNKRAVPNYDIIDSPAQYYETMYKALYNSQAYKGASAAASYAYADKNLLDVKNGGLGYQIYTVPEGEKLIGTNFKLNPNATLGYSDGDYYYTSDDWYDEIFGKGNLRQEYNVNVSGKSDKLSYYASVGYLDDSGLIKNSKFSRYTGRGNMDYQAKKWLKIGTNMAYTQSTSHQNGSTSWGSSANLFYLTNMIAPIYPMYVRDATGNIMHNETTGYVIYDNGATSTNFQRAFMSPARPAASIDNDRYTNTNSTFNGKWYANITPIEGLTLTANISATESNQRINALYSRWGGSNETSDGSAYVRSYRLSGVNTQYLAAYTHTFADKHNIDILAGYEQYKLKIQSLTGQNDHLYDPFIGELNNAGGTSNKKLNSYTDNYMTEGILSRIQYNYDGKYFLSGSYRRDASSRFAESHRWGNFGSIGGAWLISKEAFMGELKWIDMLKLKASWGIQGNDNIGNYYAYQDQFDVTYSETTGEYSKTMTYKGNKDLTWETSYAFNAGIDFELFKGRLTGTMEYFSRKTKDLLYNQPVPLSSGITTGSIPTNVGSIVNKGLELDINAILLKGRNIEWSANFNLTHYRNKITDLANNVKETGIKGSSYIYKIGGSLYQSYLKQYAGVDVETGQALYYVDPDNGNYSTTTDYSKAQQADLGSTLAKVYGGFGTTLNFYGFDFTVQLSYQLGGKLYDGTYQAMMHTGYASMAGTNWSKDILNAWTPDNRYTDVPRLCASDASYQLDSSRFLTSSDYLSINNITLGYTLPKAWLRTIGISSLRLYVTGDNLGVISARKGLDPRSRLGTGSSITAGNFTYSAMRNISGGITLSF
ncbi:TonB-dependent receptor [Bacteroides helcogenes]|uniref:TonB-dependent receptor plug n=1 Tax=Bacteroides helcogenes (strain ATCC 35417 / DSM 20613 / JCM 6297 / CCUG 15421 / P 36-108) TaxID=693979 RepID=E6SSF0_BACT6|nr:TonB-dependent receptor [Bacteroides helcogenes]ADV45201.1 TonB-dependent receptor plug [Bacteroides helcogenes P 36-108]MDY5238762.1 TonB-dependent receptor [Bacteroides helcogenes]